MHLICDHRIHYKQAIIHPGMPYNQFHVFFTGPLLLIVNFKARHQYSTMFAKSSILDVLLSSECACAACVIIISLQIFLHNIFCYFLVYGDSKLFLFQLSRLFIKLIHLYYNWQNIRIAKIGDIFQPVPK